MKKALEKLKRQLAEADAAVEARKKPPEETGPKMIGEGLVIDEWVSHICYILRILYLYYLSVHIRWFWNSDTVVFFLLSNETQKERRERYLAQQQGEGVDSV